MSGGAAPATDQTSLRLGLQRPEHRMLVLAGDACCGVVALVVALRTWNITTGFPFDATFLQRWLALWLLPAAWLLVLGPARSPRAVLSLQRTLQALTGGAAGIAAGYLLIYFYAPRSVFPRLPALYFLWETVLLTLAWRLCYLYAVSRGVFRRRALVLGRQAVGERLAILFRNHAPDVEIAAQIDPDSSDRELDEAVRTHAVSEIILAHSAPLAPALVHSLVGWQERGIDVIPMAVEYEHLLLRVPIADLPPDWMFTSLPEWVRARDASRTVKRIVDIGGSLAGLALLALVAPFTAALIALDSGRPVFYRQRRLGGGRVFEVVKFRTMVQGAESDGPRWANAADARVTRVGRWLRRSRLDELPQVISVLRGDMSIVGPRPERPEFAEQLEQQIPFYRTRLMVRPGLTGWAQVNAEYGDSVDGAALKLEYDLYYIKHRSLLFDLWIALRTVGTVFSLGGR